MLDFLVKKMRPFFWRNASISIMRVHVVEALTNTDITMNQTLWVGLYPGMKYNHLDYIVQKLEEFFGVGF